MLNSIGKIKKHKALITLIIFSAIWFGAQWRYTDSIMMSNTIMTILWVYYALDYEKIRLKAEILSELKKSDQHDNSVSV